MNITSTSSLQGRARTQAAAGEAAPSADTGNGLGSRRLMAAAPATESAAPAEETAPAVEAPAETETAETKSTKKAKE